MYLIVLVPIFSLSCEGRGGRQIKMGVDLIFNNQTDL